MRAFGILFATVFLGSTTAGAVACSGAASTDLFSTDGASATSDGGPTTTATGTSTTPTGTTTSTSTPTDPTGQPIDGGKPTPDADAGPGPDYESPGIFCGQSEGQDQFCDVGTSICCAGDTGNHSGEDSCETPGGINCIGSVPVSCDDRTDCPGGQVCCGTFDPTFGYTELKCQAACGSGSTGGAQTVRFCDPDAPKDECKEMTPPKTCTASGSMHGYYFCKGS